jgi:hypothetical protein
MSPTERARAPHLWKRPQIAAPLERPAVTQRSPLVRSTGEIVAGAAEINARQHEFGAACEGKREAG